MFEEGPSSNYAKCCVLNCPNTEEECNIVFYPFPEEDEVKELWKLSLGLNIYPRNAKVCGLHFDVEDFYVDDRGELTLKLHAIPNSDLNSEDDRVARTKGRTNSQSPSVPKIHDIPSEDFLSAIQKSRIVPTVQKKNIVVSSNEPSKKIVSVVTTGSTKEFKRIKLLKFDNEELLKDLKKLGNCESHSSKNKVLPNTPESWTKLQLESQRPFRSIDDEIDRSFDMTRKVVNINKKSEKCKNGLIDCPPELIRAVLDDTKEICIDPDVELNPNSPEKWKKSNKTCSVPRCLSNTSNREDISMHCLPKNPFIREMWKQALGIDKELSASSHFCSDHFFPEDYMPRHFDGPVQKRRLKTTAVPRRLMPIPASPIPEDFDGVKSEEEDEESEELTDEWIRLNRESGIIIHRNHSVKDSSSHSPLSPESHQEMDQTGSQSNIGRQQFKRICKRSRSTLDTSKMNNTTSCRSSTSKTIENRGIPESVEEKKRKVGRPRKHFKVKQEKDDDTKLVVDPVEEQLKQLMAEEESSSCREEKRCDDKHEEEEDTEIINEQVVEQEDKDGKDEAMKETLITQSTRSDFQDLRQAEDNENDDDDDDDDDKRVIKEIQKYESARSDRKHFENTNTLSSKLRKLPVQTYKKFFGLKNLAALRRFSKGQTDSFAIVLMKLRTAESFENLAKFFGIGVETVKTIFKETLPVVVQMARKQIVWKNDKYSSQEHNLKVLVKVYSTKVSRNVRPQKMYQEKITVILGITPEGQVSFISRPYGGRTTNEDMFVDCGILKMLKCGHSIHVDNLDVEKECNRYRISIISSGNSKKRLPTSVRKVVEVAETAKIVAEKTLNEINKFNIFKKLLGRRGARMYEDFVTCACGVINFTLFNS